MILRFLVGCSGPDSDTDAPFDALQSATAPGPWQAGYAEESVTYPDPAGGSDRTLRLGVWWPTDDATGAEVRYNGLFLDPEALGGAGVAAGGPFPVVVFSHGHQGYAENSSFLMRHLASHGWVVAAPDHTGNTTFDGSDRSTEIYFQRSTDIAAVIDHVLAPPAGHPLAGRTRGPVVAIGHSFGGYTTLALGGATYDPARIEECPDGTPFCSTMTEEWEALFLAGFRDDRITAVIAAAPGDDTLFGAGFADLAVPVLHMTAELDPAPNEAVWAALDPDDRHARVHLVGGGHQSFIDIGAAMETVPLADVDGFRIVDAYALAWAAHADGDLRYDSLLDGAIPVSDAAELSR